MRESRTRRSLRPHPRWSSPLPSRRPRPRTLIAIGLPTRIANAVDELSTGTVYLRVPLLNDAIQVGTDGRLPTATIAIRKSPSAVEVRRTDGKPLQVQILNRHERVDVFTDPVGSLTLERVRGTNNSNYWSVPTTSVRHQSALVQLVETIVSFSVTKQRRANGSRECQRTQA